MGACSFDTGGPAFNDASSNPIDALVIDGMTNADATVSDARLNDAPPPVCDPGGSDDSCSDATTLQTCRNDGSGFDVSVCPVGCVATPSPHCGDIDPTNGITTKMIDAGDGELNTLATGSLVFNTNTGEITDPTGISVFRAAGTGYDATSGVAFRVINQADGPDIGVFSFGSIAVTEGMELRGRGNNALALVASGAIQINGVITVVGGSTACLTGAVVSQSAQCAGPGGHEGGGPETAATGDGAGGFGNGGDTGFAESGGGGGGHGGMGGSGGTGTNTTPGAGGMPFASPMLVPLTGGGGGGGGGNEPQCANAPGATGGGGGGAIQIVSRATISFGPNLGGPCGINAGGGGGSASNCSSGGGGGGAGGGILLEAPAVVLNGQCTLAANGGAGSGGDIGPAAADGALSTQPAPGGISGVGGASGDGGDGAAGAMANGEAGDNGGGEAGGGGGGIGVVRVNTLGGNGFTEDGATSPAAGSGALGLQ